VTLAECYKLLHHRGYQYLRMRPMHIPQSQWVDIELELESASARATAGAHDDYFVMDDKILLVLYNTVFEPSDVRPYPLHTYLPYTTLIAECRKPLR
jgi:hypothetical protein